MQTLLGLGKKSRPAQPSNHKKWLTEMSFVPIYHCMPSTHISRPWKSIVLLFKQFLTFPRFIGTLSCWKVDIADREIFHIKSGGRLVRFRHNIMFGNVFTPDALPYSSQYKLIIMNMHIIYSNVKAAR